jgi:hypothetical protein
MQVKATRTGYYDLLRKYEGDVFTLKKREHFSAKWMEPIGWTPAGTKVVEKPEVVAAAPVADSAADFDGEQSPI